jgi:ascorbate-specific PTS system EIIC-type component UlaA
MALAWVMIAMSDNEGAFGFVECFVGELLRAGILILVCSGRCHF